MQPAILLVSPDHGELLLDEFGRYRRDYDLVVVSDGAATAEETRRIAADVDRDIALVVVDGSVRDQHPLDLFCEVRLSVPTAKRVIVNHWDRFLDDAAALRPGMAKGKYDAYLLMPRGVRDEEFHGAITELLSDWGSTVAAPEVEAVRLVSPPDVALTVEVRDFLARTGMPYGTHRPDSDVGREIIAEFGTEVPHWPLVEVPGQRVLAPVSVREVAATTYGRPDDIDVDAVVDL